VKNREEEEGPGAEKNDLTTLALYCLACFWETCATTIKMEQTDTKNLFLWALHNGVYIKGLTTKKFPCSGRGIMTTRFVNKNDLIISIPRDFLITFDTVWNHLRLSSCTKILELNHKVSGTLTAKDLFLFFLVFERKKNKTSMYRIYINSLPDAYTTPCYIPEDEIDLLPQFLKEEVDNQLSKINRHYTQLLNNKLTHFGSSICTLKCEQDVSFEDVRWAWNVINTRSVYFSSKHLKCSLDDVLGIREIDFALAPLLDMLNHESTAQVLIIISLNSKSLIYILYIY